MSTINPNQDYNCIITLTMVDNSGSFNIGFMKGSLTELFKGDVEFFFKDGEGEWEQKTTSIGAASLEYSSDTVYVGLNWGGTHLVITNGNLANPLTPMFEGQLKIKEIKISTKYVIRSILQGQFMSYFASNCKNLVKLDVIDTTKLEEIRGDGFMLFYARSCDKLEELEVPVLNRLQKVRGNFLNGYAHRCISLKKLSAPNFPSLYEFSGVTHFMPNYAKGCKSLVELGVPKILNRVRSRIGSNFYLNYAEECENLVNLEVPDLPWISAISDIFNNYAKGCVNLKSIKLPNLETVPSTNSFIDFCLNVPNLEDVVLPDSKTVYLNWDKNIFPTQTQPLIGVTDDVDGWTPLLESGKFLAINNITTLKRVEKPVNHYNVKMYHDGRWLELISKRITEDTYQGWYGITWDSVSDTYQRIGAGGYTSIQSKMRRCVLNTDGTVRYYLHPENSNLKQDGTPANITGGDGNVMVEIPKFYAKYEDYGVLKTVKLSLNIEDGYPVHPAFIKNGVEVDYRYYRAYRCHLEGDKLISVSGKTPTKDYTFPQGRTYAKANGAGWGLVDWNLLFAVQSLLLVEFSTMLIDKTLGTGNHSSGTHGRTTGQSNSLGNGSSTPANNGDFCSYRGIENFYAEYWEMIDGINFKDRVPYINLNLDTFQSDVFSGDYIAVDITLPLSNGQYVRDYHYHPKGFFPKSVSNGNASTAAGDILWSRYGETILYHGGSAQGGTQNGAYTFVSSDPSSKKEHHRGGCISF